MAEKRQVQFDEGQELADQYQMPFLETSAKQSLNVAEAFVTMTKEIKEKNMNIVKNAKLTASSTSLGSSRPIDAPQSDLDPRQSPLELGVKSNRKK